jgi:hypothetical protein
MQFWKEQWHKSSFARSASLRASLRRKEIIGPSSTDWSCFLRKRRIFWWDDKLKSWN